ncbi:MAG: hypothetical protein KDK50_06910 [Chlamydiia bacterium]|nr:hypothetical protein [Chlamydiia bacterium]
MATVFPTLGIIPNKENIWGSADEYTSAQQFDRHDEKAIAAIEGCDHWNLQKILSDLEPSTLELCFSTVSIKPAIALESIPSPIEMLQIAATIRSLAKVALEKRVKWFMPDGYENERSDMALCLYTLGIPLEKLLDLGVSLKSFRYGNGLNAMHVAVLAKAQLEPYCQQRGWIYSAIVLLATPQESPQLHEEILENCRGWKGCSNCLRQLQSDPNYHLNDKELQDLWGCRRSISGESQRKIVQIAQREGLLMSLEMIEKDLEWLTISYSRFVDYADRNGNTPLHLAAALLDQGTFEKMASVSCQTVLNKARKAPVDMQTLSVSELGPIRQRYKLFNG